MRPLDVIELVMMGLAFVVAVVGAITNLLAPRHDRLTNLAKQFDAAPSGTPARASLDAQWRSEVARGKRLRAVIGVLLALLILVLALVRWTLVRRPLLPPPEVRPPAAASPSAGT